MSMISKLCSDLRNAADDGCCPNRDRTLMRYAADTIEALSAKKLDGYTKWIEEKLLECEPSILCDVVCNEQGGECDGCEHQMRPECLRKCYEICKGEKL